jgi:serine/threonine-protein kinase
MRLIKGQTLAAMLEERPDPAHELGRFLTVFEQVCQTVAYAHARGVIHRDLKPSNIMVGAFGEVQVVDWGLSKVLHQGGEEGGDADSRPAADEPQVTTVRSTSGSALSQSGSIIGTPSYMSPEQAKGEVEGLDELTDVFALGAILCEILTGQPPYTGDRSEILQEAAVGRLGATFTRLDSRGAERELVRIAKRCLDPTGSARPRNAGVLAREIAGFLESVRDRARAAEVAAAEARARADAERNARRRTGVLGLALGLAISTGVGIALFAERNRRTRAEQSIADVVALYGKADWFSDQARFVPPDQLGRWEQALAQVRRTAEIVGAGAPDERTRQNVRNLLVKLKREEDQVHERVEQYRLQQRRPTGQPAAPGGETARGAKP